jgi:hypothetical protein
MLSEDYFLSILYRTNHQDKETSRILQTLNRYVTHSRDIFYSLEIINEKHLRFKPNKDLADDCLISLALFNKHIKHLFDYRAAPSERWYCYVGKNAFVKTGHEEIAQNYGYWIHFIREHMLIDSKL